MKLDRLDMSLLNHALDLRVKAIKLLYQEIELGILDIANVQEQVDMNKKQIFGIHKKIFKFWQGKDGNWFSYLPKEGVEPPKGRLVKKVSEERLVKAILDFYIEEEKAKNVNAPTFKDIYDLWREIKNLELVDNSILKYDGDYKRYFEGTEFSQTPINQITENTIKKFMLETIKNLKLCREASGRLFSYIRNTIRYARVEKIITENPVEFLELKDFTKHSVEKEKAIEEHFYSDKELIMIQEGLITLYGDMPLYMPRYAIELAMLTGMRPGEIAPLKWEDISETTISINKSEKHNRRNNTFSIGKTKTGKSREFPICSEITRLFKRIRAVQEENGTLSDYIFSDGDNGHIHGQHIGDCMRRLTKAVGIHGGSITALRKTINSNLRRSGVPVTIVASMLGHTTEVNDRYYTYDTSNLEEKKEIIEKRNARVTTLAQISET